MSHVAPSRWYPHRFWRRPSIFPLRPSSPRRRGRESSEYQATRAIADYQASATTVPQAIQALVLINGGAATALLAFLSKATPPPFQTVLAASVSLILYAFGVGFAVYSMWSSSQSTLFHALYWEGMLSGDSNATNDRTTADRWLWSHRWCFILSGACFFLASLIFAATLQPSAVVVPYIGAS
jgi:hypothetical protein